MVGDRIHEVSDAATAIFEQQWQVYRKMVDNNYLCHREVYGLLRDILIRDASQPFRFLDVACGDAGETIKALRGTHVAHYAGIDLSGPALALARAATAELGCAIELIRRDFAEALEDWREPVDVAWIGQSVHHLRTSGKLMVMRAIRRLLGDQGLLLIYEPTSRDNEGRDAWLDRWERHFVPKWTALEPDEKAAMIAHVRAADFPETHSRWLALGREAGFSDARALFTDPLDLFRMYCFQA